MSITIYAGNYNNTAKKEQKAYVGYNNKAVEIFSEPLANVYGAVWDGSSTTTWTRTDSAKNFSNPNPYYAGMSGTPSSPFDDIMPWKGMTVSDDSNAGKIVAIPKFYYKMGYASGTTGLKIQISMSKHEGFKCSPAHMDRGDGTGERDVVYVGRYHCASDYKSKTGVTPKVSATRETFRSGIHNLGSTIWQWDFATLVTIWMLYLVEFADWQSQGKIGGGSSATSSTSSAVFNMGYTDSMPYHTGTVSSSISRTVYGGTQYRNIEGLWDNCYNFIEGLRFDNNAIYAILNPSSFSDSTGGTQVGTKPSSSNYTSAFGISAVTDFEWAMFPSAISGSDSTYVCDFFHSASSGTISFVGGGFQQSQINGLFYISANQAGTFNNVNIGSRLMVLP